MLAVARRKPYPEQVERVERSAQNYRAERRFGLAVMTGHPFQVLRSGVGVLAVLPAIRSHLDERGSAAFETRNPRLDWAGGWRRGPPPQLAQKYALTPI